jgi:hypothetical protein
MALRFDFEPGRRGTLLSDRLRNYRPNDSPLAPASAQPRRPA